MLKSALSSGDVLHQIKLNEQIFDLKNKVDSSLSMREYLLDYKYSQLKSMTESGDPAVDKYIEQEISKRTKSIKEDIFTVVEEKMKENSYHIFPPMPIDHKASNTPVSNADLNRSLQKAVKITKGSILEVDVRNSFFVKSNFMQYKFL